MFLYKNREMHKTRSAFYRAWMKRIYHLPDVVLNEIRICRIRIFGAKVGHLVVIGNSKINGRKEFLKIGSGSSLGRCLIELHEQVNIGCNVAINDGVKILTASHDVHDERWGTIARPVVLGDHAWIAMNAIILPGVTIGNGAVVGAGAVVRCDVPDFAVAVGNPAKILLGRRCRALDYRPSQFNAAIRAWLGSHE